MYLFHSLTAIQRTGQDLPAGSTPFVCCSESSVKKYNGKASVGRLLDTGLLRAERKSHNQARDRAGNNRI